MTFKQGEIMEFELSIPQLIRGTTIELYGHPAVVVQNDRGLIGILAKDVKTKDIFSVIGHPVGTNKIVFDVFHVIHPHDSLYAQVNLVYEKS